MPPTPIDPSIRYRAKFDQRGPDECWPWQAARYKNDYGAFWDGTKRTGAHRFGYTLHVGPIPRGLCVLHKCDYRPCQNPAHWFLGTVLDNNTDRHTKGRSRGPRGEQAGSARLSKAQVGEIRRLHQGGLPHRAIADAFSINRASVSAIVHGARWAHLPDLIDHRDGRTPLVADQVLEIRRRYDAGESQYALARAFGVSRPTVAGIVTRRYWKHV